MINDADSDASPTLDLADDWLRAHGRRVGTYLFAAALGLMLLYLSQYARSPFFLVNRLDALYNVRMADAIRHDQLPSEPFFRAPGHAAFLVAVRAIFGESPWAPRLLQAILGALSVVLTWRLASRVFRPIVGALAGVMAAFYGPLIYNNCELHTAPLEVFLDLAFLNALIDTNGSTGSTAARPIRASALAGIALGLSAIVRPNALLWLPLAALWLLTERRRPLPQRVTLVGIVAGLALLPAAMVTARNARVAHDPVFIASQGGINLFLGNRAEADGFTPSTPTRYRFDGVYEDSVALYGTRAAADALGHSVSASESSRYWTGEAIRYWRKSPVDALSLTGRKLWLALGRVEVRNNTAFDFIRGEWAPALWAAPLDFGVCAALGLPGLLLYSRKSRETKLLSAAFVLYLAGIVAFFAADRYRLPLVPILLAFAANLAVNLYAGLASHRARRAAPAFVLAAVSALVFLPTWIPTASAATRALDHWSAGNRLLALGNPIDAEAQMRRALALDPNSAEIWSGLGESLYYQQRFPDAAVAFGESIRRAPDRVAGYLNLALTLRELGRNDDARQLLAEALRRDPTYTRAREELAQLPAR